jgi:hypothetical protein
MLQMKAGKDVDVLTGGMTVKQADIIYFMHMAIIIFCFIQSRKTDKGRMKRKQLL